MSKLYCICTIRIKVLLYLIVQNSKINNHNLCKRHIFPCFNLFVFPSQITQFKQSRVCAEDFIQKVIATLHM